MGRSIKGSLFKFNLQNNHVKMYRDDKLMMKYNNNLIYTSSIGDPIEYLHKDENKITIKNMSTVIKETHFAKGFEIQCKVFSQESIQSGHDNALKN